MTCVIICVLASYLVGGIPFAFLLGKLKGVDIRTVGSGNIGATNLTRSVGRYWGITAFCLDFMKGLAPVLLSPFLRDPSSQTPSVIDVQILSGLAAILGHTFPVYLLFRGGKGVATTFGVMSGLMWLSALSAGVLWCLIYLATRTASLASMAGALGFPLATWLFYQNHPSGEFYALEGFALGVSILILVRHASNIQRLFKGKEHRF